MTTSKFINVDLCLKSKQTIQPLIDAIEPYVSVLYCGPDEKDGYCAALELLKHPKNANLAINNFYKIFYNLSLENRERWFQLSRRIFDIGIEAGTESSPFYELLRRDTLLKIHICKAEIAITVYKPEL